MNVNAIRVKMRLESHVLDLPELRPWVGKAVEIIVLEDEPPADRPRDMSALGQRLLEWISTLRRLKSCEISARSDCAQSSCRLCRTATSLRPSSAILDDYEAARISPIDVERAIRSQVEAIEALPYSRIKEAERLCYRLVVAHESDGKSEFVDEEDAAAVLADFRTFLSTLPDSGA